MVRVFFTFRGEEGENLQPAVLYFCLCKPGFCRLLGISGGNVFGHGQLNILISTLDVSCQIQTPFYMLAVWDGTREILLFLCHGCGPMHSVLGSSEYVRVVDFTGGTMECCNTS